ncbi:hypothetical protein J6590_019182 [Homalodisca vitripennis]|nr:hypothetical protein J6590_019182 [Homalodisca vitripennis]
MSIDRNLRYEKYLLVRVGGTPSSPEADPPLRLFITRARTSSNIGSRWKLEYASTVQDKTDRPTGLHIYERPISKTVLMDD